MSDWQQMFDDIYPRDAATLGTGRSTMGLFEELGELAEAVRVFEKHPKYFAGEAADVFSYLMGIANEHRLKAHIDERPVFDFEGVFLRKYPGLCVQCGHQVCICPSIPESTVGRLAKEIDLAASENLFGLDAQAAEVRGRTVGESVLQELGGLPAIAHQLPLDRGEANQALVLLCLKLASEVNAKDRDLANGLQHAAIQIATDTRTPGSRGHGKASVAVLELLSKVWPLLSLAVIPQDRSLPARLGSLLRVQSVRIGVVTALPKEFAAMRAMLEEEINSPVANDPNHYVLGRIPSVSGTGDHLVVVTLLKEMGNNSAAAAATHLLRSFPNVEDVLMVGIAGGIPSANARDTDLRLGDIVVSNREGVIQYDNLKLESSSITVRSNTAKPSSRMIGAVNILETERLMKRYPWETYLARAHQLENSSRPVEDSPPGGRPRVHLGRIGAANILLKNSIVRDELRREHSILAVEMEGSGIADATWNAGQHYLIVRGVCDFCDENKNDVWQGYAAVAAASYARAVISVVDPASYRRDEAQGPGL